MAAISLPTPRDIQSVVEEDISLAGGKVINCVIDDHRLFLRSVLPQVRQVCEDDRMQAGVAVTVNGTDIFVHPFTFREVCRNGAVMAHALDTVHVERVAFEAPAGEVAEVLLEVRKAVQHCAEPGVFSNVVQRLRRAADTQADMVLQLLMSVSHPNVIRDILDRLIGDMSLRPRPSAYNLMNAITRAARDQPDPQVRWDLEELGGGIPARISPSPEPDNALAPLGAV